MLRTLFLKFTGSAESIFIFEQIGVEPWGRFATGATEFIATILLLIPKTTWMGAFLGASVTLGAIFSHLTLLGIEVQDDGGVLFMLAIVVFGCCISLLWLNKEEIPIIRSSSIPQEPL